MWEQGLCGLNWVRVESSLWAVWMLSVCVSCTPSGMMRAGSWISTCLCLQLFHITQETSLPVANNSNDSLVLGEGRLLDHLYNQKHRVQHIDKPRPVLDAKQPITVSFSITLIQIMDLEQKRQKLTTQLWLSMGWKDEFMKWDPDEFEGIKVLRMDKSSLWTPDVILYNIYGKRNVENHNTLVNLASNGEVLWMPPVTYESSCQIDLKDFPFDTQLCSLVFGSWAHSLEELDLIAQNSTEAFNMAEYIINLEWSIIKTEVLREEKHFSCCSEPYVILIFNLHLKRNSGFYARVMLMPVLLLSVAALFIFCVPPQRPDRTTLGLSLFTSFMLLLLLVVDISPPSAESRLGTYLSVYVCLVTSAMLFSLLLISISSWKGRVPHWVRTVFLENLALVILPCTPRIAPRSSKNKHKTMSLISSNTNDTQQPSGSPERKPTSSTYAEPGPSEWAMLVTVLDRIFFLLYTVFLVVSVVMYFPRPV